jgi:homopolymeric O-antigen transport system permease protein
MANSQQSVGTTAAEHSQSLMPTVGITVLRPTHGWVNLGLRGLYDYRELLLFLTWRDIKVRYRQTFLGAAWAIVQPLASVAVFMLVFFKLAKVPSEGVPYPLFALTGLLPWQLFNYALTRASISVVANNNLVSKVYFPRLVVPVSAVLSGLVDFAVAFVVLLLAMLYYGFPMGWHLVAVPLVMLFALLTALAVGLWLAALNVRYRDIQQVIPFLAQFWLYATPIGYPSSLIPARFRLVIGLNPMAGVVEAFRWALLGLPPSSVSLMILSAFVVIFGCVGGAAYFRRVEKTFADII